MNDIGLTILGIVVGIIASVVVSKYYFEKSFKKNLTPFLHFHSTPLKDIAEEVRKDLRITYLDKPVEDLFEIQFIIANNGSKAIRDIIEPLSLSLPSNCGLFDATILHKQPSELKVSTEYCENSKKLALTFPLMNSGDFFILKLLLNGNQELSNFKFSITVDELPPILEVKNLEIGSVSTKEQSGFDGSLCLIGLFFTIMGISLSYLIGNQWTIFRNPETPLAGLYDFVFNIISLGWDGLAIGFSTIPALTLLVVGVMMFAAAFTGGTFPPSKTKFILPKDKADRAIRNRG